MSASMPTETVASVLAELDAACPCRIIGKCLCHISRTCECDDKGVKVFVEGMNIGRCYWKGHRLARELARVVANECKEIVGDHRADANCPGDMDKECLNAIADKIAALPLEGVDE